VRSVRPISGTVIICEGMAVGTSGDSRGAAKTMTKLVHPAMALLSMVMRAGTNVGLPMVG
jgi:hypothetical protein